MLTKIIHLMRRLSENWTYTSRRGLARGLKLKGGLGFIPSPGTLEEKFLQSLDIRGQTVYDVGGGKGIFTLFFARCAGSSGKVITFEPHPENYRSIVEQSKLNKFENVAVYQLALGSRKGNGLLAVRKSDTGTGSLQEDIMASILKEKGAKTLNVEIDTLDNQVKAKDLPRPDFIKIDVEGLELDVLSGMSGIIDRYKPKLFIEIHGVDMRTKSENVHRIVDCLLARRYSIYHVESGNTITLSNADSAREGHLYCT